MNAPDREPPPGEVRGGALAVVVAVPIVVSAVALYGAAAAVLGTRPTSEATLSGRSVALVVCAAVLGALPQVIRSLSVSLGCRKLGWRAVFAHVLSLPVAVFLAAVLVFDAGLLGAERADPYGLAALAAAAGIFADGIRRALPRVLGLKRKAT